MLTFLPHTYRGTKAKVAISSIKVNGQSEVQQRAKWRWTKEGQCQCTPRNMTDIRGNTWPEECREQESLSLLRPGQTRSNLETTWVSVLVWVPLCSAIWRFFAELFQQCKDAAFAPSGLCCFKLPGCMLWSLQHLNIALQRSAVHLFLLWSHLRLYILFRLMEPVLNISRMWPKQVVHQGQLTFVAPKALAFGIASFCTGMENDWRSGRKTIFQVPWSIIVSPLSGVRLLVAHR